MQPKPLAWFSFDRALQALIYFFRQCKDVFSGLAGGRELYGVMGRDLKICPTQTFGRNRKPVAHYILMQAVRRLVLSWHHAQEGARQFHHLVFDPTSMARESPCLM